MMDFSVLELPNAGLIALALGAAALLIWAWRRAHASNATPPSAGRPRALDAVDTVIGWPPDATRVLTLRHQRAYEVLRRALPDHLILAQVPLSHFIKVPTRHSYVEWLRRVGHVCVDLMICDASSNVLAVVEVRQADKAETDRARKRHARVERVLRAAGIPMHVWSETLLPDPSAVRKAFVPGANAQDADAGPDTSPLDPTVHGPGRTRGRSPAEAQAHAEPPRSTWFDELNATQPSQLESVEVTTHVGGHPSVPMGAFKTASPGER